MMCLRCVRVLSGKSDKKRPELFIVTDRKGTVGDILAGTGFIVNLKEKE